MDKKGILKKELAGLNAAELQKLDVILQKKEDEYIAELAANLLFQPDKNPKSIAGYNAVKTHIADTRLAITELIKDKSAV